MDLENLSTEELKNLKDGLRKEIAEYDTKQLAYKTLSNAAYGALGNQFFRYFDVRLAESITLTGQAIIHFIGNGVNKYLNEKSGTEGKNYVIYCDTDSVYIHCDDFVKSVCSSDDIDDHMRVLSKLDSDELQPLIDKLCGEFAEMINSPHPEVLAMKRECLITQAIWKKKKQYALMVKNSEGTEYAKPKMKITGIECVKSSTPLACRSKLKNAIKIILLLDERKLVSYVRKFEREFYGLPINDIAFTTSVKTLDDYRGVGTLYKKKCPMAVRGSLIYNNLIEKMNLTGKYDKIQQGEKVRFVHLIVPNPMKIDENVIAYPAMSELPPEFGLEDYVDRRTHFEKGFINILSKLTDACEWDLSYDQKSLF